jgi:hypothetical protein
VQCGKADRAENDAARDDNEHETNVYPVSTSGQVAASAAGHRPAAAR